MRKRVANLRKAKIKTTLDGARIQANQAKALAPVYTGNLIRNILIRKTKNGHSVISIVPGEFPYHLWVNGSPGFEVVRLRWNNYEPTVYGDGPAMWTGTRGYFDKAIEKTKRDIPKKYRQNIRNAIR